MKSTYEELRAKYQVAGANTAYLRGSAEEIADVQARKREALTERMIGREMAGMMRPGTIPSALAGRPPLMPTVPVMAPTVPRTMPTSPGVGGSPVDQRAVQRDQAKVALLQVIAANTGRQQAMPVYEEVEF